MIHVFEILSNHGHIFTVCSEYVQSAFRVCSKCVQSVFRVCSECAQSVFRVCSECAQSRGQRESFLDALASLGSMLESE